jgi:hypothetical protein
MQLPHAPQTMDSQIDDINTFFYMFLDITLIQGQATANKGIFEKAKNQICIMNQACH